MPAWSINKKIRTPLLLIAGVEAVIVFSSVYVAGLIVFGSIELCQEVLGSLAPRALLVSVITLLSLIAMGLYHFHQRLYFHEAAVRVIVGMALGSFCLAILFYAFPSVMVTRDIAGLAAAYSLALLLIARYFFVRTVDRNMFRHRTLVYGAGQRAASIRDLRRRADRRGFVIVGSVIADGDEVLDDTKVIRCNGRSITEIAAENNADEIVVALDDRRGNLPVKDLLKAKLAGLEVIDLLEFLERETGKIRIDLVSPGWLIFSRGFRMSGTRMATKRFADILVSTSALLLTWPIMLIVAAAIKFEDGLSAPVFYSQQRVGKRGAIFSLLKFRSMSIDAEADGKARWAAENDIRITRIGSFLRKSRLDELPQILNVLRGEMSLVGPRPERPEFVDELQEQIPYYSERLAVKPGITGWAQLRYSYGSSHEDAIEKLQYDLYYIKNHSPTLDIMILLQTAEVIIWGKGAR